MTEPERRGYMPITIPGLLLFLERHLDLPDNVTVCGLERDTTFQETHIMLKGEGLPEPDGSGWEVRLEGPDYFLTREGGP